MNLSVNDHFSINTLTHIAFFLYHRTITSIRQQRARPILLVDMDETLIHCFSNAENERLCIGNYTNDEILKFSLPDTTMIGGRDRRFTVVKRQGAVRLMSELHRHFEMHVWTAGVREYADKVLDWLEDQPLFQSKRIPSKPRRNKNDGNLE